MFTRSVTGKEFEGNTNSQQ